MVLEVSYSTRTTFNIKNGTLKTTYNDNGYQVVFKVDGTQVNVPGTSTNGKASNGNCNIVTTLSLISLNMFVNVGFTVSCTDQANHTIGIAVHADISIGNVDSAPITNIEGDRGFIMSDGTNSVNMLLRDSYGSINVDTYWYGGYSSRTSNLWKNGTQSSPTYYDLKGVDSGMAFSWDNRLCQPGETLRFSLTSGIGKIMKPPELKMTKIPKDKYQMNPDLQIPIAGTVYHPDADRTCIVRYYIDVGEEIELASGLDVGQKTVSFSGYVQIPILSGGYHTMFFYAQDNKGIPSNAVNVRFYYDPFPRTVKKAKKKSVNSLAQIAGLYSLANEA
ncbi:hypothetical protein TVAG_134250 [Trichomonas vaginalis G3]|uniref:Uncharacterized protein n=1 Tax=Trichomonas vaginalis (strain ATCC PRA-98 / G3) TaxID=412133 RepID=A2F376_TRIV3|nr:Listeria-Bacteroides repeat domain (List Bact rpt) family [Trichomonas vaginalis G3]EAY00635.1 hypothetical protein TVAG_134250 [Trichomonas vaginalis G3]KAI5499999.1 Listeria-Bacteroides repeat domain (List Bact rpt) family [Trichomonas vaginalis G3]|eukprot:XP_001313564.1 hypothetical protein [Trichomonas vaginalis G3]